MSNPRLRVAGRRARLLVPAAVIVAALTIVSPAGAALVANFEIDGDLSPAGATDWTSVISATRNADGTCTQTGGAAKLICDPAKTDASTFPGGAKESDPPGWLPIQTSQVTPKTDITNVYAFERIDPTTGHAVILNGMERLPKAGDVHFDFEFNQATTGTGASTLPDRRVNDLLIAYDLGGSVSTNLGSLRIRVYKARAGLACGGTCPGYDYDHPDVDVSGGATLSGSGVTAAMNTATIASGGWKSYDDHYSFVSTIPAFSFAEAAIDVNQALGQSGNLCLNFITVKSRSSESVTSQLKDTTGTQPFPFCRNLSGTKFKDVNGNGVQESGEPGLGGFTFQLLNGSTVLQTATSGTDGTYSFSNVFPGTYTVHEVGQKGWLQTAPSSGDRTITVTAGSGSQSIDKFGNTPLSNVSLTFTPQAVLPGTTTAATKATISCKDAANNTVGAQSGNTYTANNLQVKQSVLTCTVTITDP